MRIYDIRNPKSIFRRYKEYTDELEAQGTAKVDLFSILNIFYKFLSIFILTSPAGTVFHRGSRKLAGHPREPLAGSGVNPVQRSETSEQSLPLPCVLSPILSLSASLPLSLLPPSRLFPTLTPTLTLTQIETV